MKKLIKLLLPGLLAFIAIIGGVHVHDENCGYDSETETGCIYDEVDPAQKPSDETNPPH